MNHSVINCCVPRARKPSRIDDIVEAATRAFIESGFDRAKIHRIAEAAGVGPGTVYLYAEDKEALFELALLRSLESPAVAHPALPYRKTPAESITRLIEDCLHEIAHFPQLWVASQRREPGASLEEYHGILLELARWMKRYRSAILLVDRNRHEWPDLADSFGRIVWADVQRRLTGYVAARMRSGALAAVADPALVARFTVDALAAALIVGPLVPLAPGRGQEEEPLVRLVAAGVAPSGNRLPLSPHSGEDPAV
jgi:AcrR family transcriptional regulator